MESLIINEEECKPIKGFEKYHISESGRVYRTKAFYKREAKNLANGDLYTNEKKIFFKFRHGKIQPGLVSLMGPEKKLYYKAVAPLVAIAFGVVSKRSKKVLFDYKDGNIRNLHYSNLCISKKASAHSKFTKEDVKEIKKQISEKVPLNHIGKAFGVSEMQINRIKTGENWGNGKRKILAPVAPFEIKDGKIRKYIAIFDRKPASKEIKKRFYVKRNPEKPTDNLIIGILNGFKLSLKHANITRAEINVKKLNNYFFDNPPEKKENIQSIINQYFENK